MRRRSFFKVAGTGSAGLLMSGSLSAQSLTAPSDKKIKPISGSWFEFQHLLPSEGRYWDPALAKFTAEQWKEKVKEISELGFEYLVLQEIALVWKSYLPFKAGTKI